VIGFTKGKEINDFPIVTQEKREYLRQTSVTDNTATRHTGQGAQSTPMNDIFEWEPTRLPERYLGPNRRSKQRRSQTDRRQEWRLEVGKEDRRRTTGRRVADRLQ